MTNDEIIDLFYETTGYADNTHAWGVKKYRIKNGERVDRDKFDFKSPSKMIRDFIKFKEKLEND